LISLAAWGVASSIQAGRLEQIEQALAGDTRFDLVLRWNEIRSLPEGTVTVHGFQLRDKATGREYSLYYDADGQAMPAAFIAAHQRQWQAVSSASMTSETVSGPTLKAAGPKAQPTAGRGKSAAAQTVRLDPPDLAAVQDEDQRMRALGERSFRIGIYRDLPAPVRMSDFPAAAWQTTADGDRVLSIQIESAEAVALRLLVTEASFPDGVSVVVYNTDQPDEMYGPYPGESGSGATAFWTETVFGHRATLECRAAAGAALDDARFTLSRLIHRYVDIAKAGPILKVGNCHNDVACFNAWLAAAAAVAGIATAGEPGELYCTGSLLADTVPTTAIPYFMTANHCVGNQFEANSAEFYWFYQRNACGGSVPNPATVPRTFGGADYLAGSSPANADFSLLRIRNAVPNGTTLAGWIATTPGIGTGVTGIHHPDGSYKRISFGSLFGYDGQYHLVRWTSGVTEPGSSGSPLYNSSAQFLGQLSYGDSFCFNPQGLDGYGRFDVAYPVVQPWINPGNQPPPNAASPVLNMLVMDSHGDYDGDGITDFCVYHPAAGNWHIRRSQTGTVLTQNWGWNQTQPIAGDFDNDDLTDIAVYLPTLANWYIRRSSNGSLLFQQWGWSATRPAPGDYDGDGLTDIAVYHPATGNWYIRRSSNGTLLLQQWGWSEAIPCPADYDGDGRTDIAVYHPATGNWYIRQSSNGALRFRQWGFAAARPVPGKYDADNQADLAVCEPISGTWYILRSTMNNLLQQSVGMYTTPVPGDYDGDGRFDPAGYHLNTANWYIQKSTGGPLQRQFGWSAAVPPGTRF
jgi:hypothetical protein